jgi:hypothetical protein
LHLKAIKVKLVHRRLLSHFYYKFIINAINSNFLQIICYNHQNQRYFKLSNILILHIMILLKNDIFDFVKFIIPSVPKLQLSESVHTYKAKFIITLVLPT